MLKNFFTSVCDNLEGSSEETTGKFALEYDVDDDTMIYASFTAGSKPGGTNLTYGFTTQAELDANFLFTSPLVCLLYTSPSPRDGLLSRMPSSA